MGSQVTDAMGRRGPDGLIGIHTNLLTPALGDADALSQSPPTTEERAALDALVDSMLLALGTSSSRRRARRPSVTPFWIHQSPWRRG